MLIQLSIPSEKSDASGGFPVAIHDSNLPRGHFVLHDLPLHHEGWLPEDFQRLAFEHMRSIAHSDALKNDLPAGLEDVSDGEFLPWMTPASLDTRLRGCDGFEYLFDLWQEFKIL